MHDSEREKQKPKHKHVRFPQLLPPQNAKFEGALGGCGTRADRAELSGLTGGRRKRGGRRMVSNPPATVPGGVTRELLRQWMWHDSASAQSATCWHRLQRGRACRDSACGTRAAKRVTGRRYHPGPVVNIII